MSTNRRIICLLFTYCCFISLSYTDGHSLDFFNRLLCNKQEVIYRQCQFICAVGTYWINGECRPRCPSGTVWRNGQCQSICPPGSAWIDRACRIVYCLPGKIWVNGACRYTCSSGSYWSNGGCQLCNTKLVQHLVTECYQTI